jgi:3-deoxy-D-manno-octulosonic-acid transferase
VGAISPDDAERFGRLGVSAERRSVMGDARFDQVWRRAESVDRAAELLKPFSTFDEPVLVAGSTWPEDERHLVLAVAALRQKGRPVRLVLVPHEPTPAHVRQAEERITGAGLSLTRIGDLAAGDENAVVVVDRVGVLGDLYAVADVAYVGGGFGSAGLHSVLEPAAFGAPVLFGPRHTNAREAGELVAAGGAFEVSSAEEMERILAGLLDVYEVRARAGAKARAYVQARLGAAERGAEMVERML